MRPLLSPFARGGRGAHDPAPASASLHRLRRQTVLRGTVNPSSRWHGWGQRTAPRATGRGGTSIPIIPPPKPFRLGLGRKGHSHPTRQSPLKPGRAVFGSGQHARGRGIDGPPEGSLRPKAVERSADRRRTVDPSPFHTQQEAPSPPRTRESTRVLRTSAASCSHD